MNGETLFGSPAEQQEFSTLAADRADVAEATDATTIWCLTITITLLFTC
jgi:hypothetical protein